MKNEGEVVIRERLNTTLPKEYIGWLGKHVEARIYFGRSHCHRSLNLRSYEKGKEGIDYERD